MRALERFGVGRMCVCVRACVYVRAAAAAARVRACEWFFFGLCVCSWFFQITFFTACRRFRWADARTERGGAIGSMEVCGGDGGVDGGNVGRTGGRKAVRISTCTQHVYGGAPKCERLGLCVRV